MKDFSTEKSRQLAEEMGWTMERAEGYVDGETCGQRGMQIDFHQKMGMDEYSKGFRTGYYKQTCSIVLGDLRETALTH